MMSFWDKHRVVLVVMIGVLSVVLAGCGSTDTAEKSSAKMASSHHAQGGGCPDGLKPDKTVELTERAWKYFPDSIEVRQGDVVKVKMKVTDNGVGAGHGFAIEGFEQQVFLNGVTKGNPESTCFEANKPPGDYVFYCATQCSTDKRHTNMDGTLTILPRDAEKSSSSTKQASAESEKSYEDLSQAEKWEQVKLPTPVPASSEDMVEKGKKLYNGKLACSSCHGSKGKGDGPAAGSLTNTKTGEPISPRNFRDPANYKWGVSRKAIARTILSGGKNPGSPMPPMKGTVKPDELWAVATYVKSLQQ